MATITLYKDKVNGVGGLIDGIIKSVNNLDVQLNTLKSTLQGVDSSTCNLQDTVDSISSSSKSEKEKVGDLKKLNNKLTEFIIIASNRDKSACDHVNQKKEDFYSRYKYLKPECEKSRTEKIVDGIKKACEWCKEHWKEILIAIEIIVAVVCLFVPGLEGFGVLILNNILKGLIIGLISGAVIGAISGYAQNGAKGILSGVLNGAKDGALLGAAFGGLGGIGSLSGKLGGCSTFMTGLFSVSSKLSFGMMAFDGFALISDFQTRFQKDTGINLRLVNSDIGEFISDLNHKAHTNPFYNGLQLFAGGAAVFSGGYVKTAACFVAGTLVATINGLMAIEEIKVGDIVLAFDEGNLKTAYKTVVETYVHKTHKLIHLTINGEKIIATEDHPIYVNGKGFIQAVMLWIGAELVDHNGDTVTVDYIYHEQLYGNNRTVYNFKVDELHTYYVGNTSVLVHNSQCPVPEKKKASNGLNYKSNSKHTPGQPGNRPNAGIEPKNSFELFEKSVQSSKNPRMRFTYDKSTNTLHRFSPTDNRCSEYHWSGSTNQGANSLTSVEVPSDIIKQFNMKKKGW